MDSRLIAGAYSQHFRALEHEADLADTDKFDSIARAKKLSHETNKRRKSQAQKRKIEAQREEKRRLEILSKRREEQNQATEKYQRSHIPPSARQQSGRRSPRRPGGGAALEDALRLIRSSPRHSRPASSRSERVTSPRKENQDPFVKSYFNRYQIGRPGSARPSHQTDAYTRAELMDHSLQNLTSSKTLFERQLEQQQSLLLEQQQQSMRDFNKAVKEEIESDLVCQDGEDDDQDVSNLDDSCSSADSLESSNKSGRKKTGNWRQEIQQAQAAAVMSDTNNVTGVSNITKQQQIIPEDKAADHFFLNYGKTEHNNDHSPLNLDMTPSATYQIPSLQAAMPQATQTNDYQKTTQQALGLSTTTNTHSTQQNTTLKQFSTDSLESSSSNISVLYTNTPDPVTQNIPSSHSGPHTSVQSQMAWVSTPLNTNNSGTGTQSNSSTRNVDNVPEAYNPRYASAISLSIWSGQGSYSGSQPSSAGNVSTANTISQAIVNNASPYGTRAGTSTTIPTVSPAPLPRTVTIATSYATAVLQNDKVLKSGIVGNALSSVADNSSSHAEKISGLGGNLQDSKYSQQQGYKSLSAAQKLSQPHTTLGTMYTQQQQQQPYLSGNETDMMLPQPTSTASAQGQVHSILQPQPFLQSPYPMIQNQLKNQNNQLNMLLQQQQLQQYQPDEQHHFQANQNMLSSTSPAAPITTTLPMGIPVPAVRSVFPAQRPPVPKVDPSLAQPMKVNPSQEVGSDAAKTGLPDKVETSSVPGDDQTDPESNAPRIKGILKSGPGTSLQPQAVGKPGGQPRDSLELARFQADKKGKKKSVRFAENHIEETFEDEEDASDYRKMVITNTGIPMYRPTITRPASAKVISTTQRSDATPGKMVRATSAGSTRSVPPNNLPPAAAAAPPKSKGVAFNIPAGPTQVSTGGAGPSPQSLVLPNNAASPHVTNRPKAAAHIIMSSSSSGGNSSPGHTEKTGNSQVAATAHKSHLESKVKNITSSTGIGGRGAIRVPSSASTVTVYNVATSGLDDQTSHYNMPQHKQNQGSSDCHSNGIYTPDEESIECDNGATHMYSYGNGNSYQLGGHESRPRIRDPSPASKRVPISNTTVTRTSIVPASTKISIPQSNSGAPSYSASAPNGWGAASHSPAVYDENGLRIDRTPTDEEITWLWDKVRTCLNKDEPPTGGGGGAGARAQADTGNSGAVDQARQAPTLSTKLIDGTALGIGMNGTNGLRTGSGFFQPHPNSAQNKVRPALQQQGSYLRRYGLLKQRRATSATGSGPTQPHVGSMQRASSASHIRQQRQVGNRTLTAGQPQQQDQEGPQPISQAYVPQDGVSDSTAAFIMAERLAKQSLSDSHIQAGMQDAQHKQEAHNTRTRLAVNRGGQSALSIEEQNLLASLDKLNERLRTADTHYPGTIHYHQPYQAHLSGFRGNQTPVFDGRRQMILSPRTQALTQQRSQSAKIRQHPQPYR